MKQKIAKDLFIAQIMSDINEIPWVYLKTLYALVHTFKENILTIPSENAIPMPTPKDEDDNFDWDNLLKDIHLNRQKNNILLTKFSLQGIVCVVYRTSLLKTFLCFQKRLSL